MLNLEIAGVDDRVEVECLSCYCDKKVIIVIIIFLHGLGRLTCSGIDALPSSSFVV